MAVPSNIAKGIAPLMAAGVWAIGHNYQLLEWSVLGLSLSSAVAFLVAKRCAHRHAALAASVEP